MCRQAVSQDSCSGKQGDGREAVGGDGPVLEAAEVGQTLPQRDADWFQVNSPYSVPTVGRFYVNTPLTTSNVPRSTQTYVSTNGTFNGSYWSTRGLDDLRSSYVGIVEAGATYSVGVSGTSVLTASPRLVDDPLRIDASTSDVGAISSDTLIALASRMLRSDEVAYQPQVEFLDIRNTEVPEYNLSATSAVVFTYDNPTGGFDPGEVKVTMFRAGPGTNGQRIRVYSNTRGDCAVLNSDGSVAVVGFDNVQHRDFVSIRGLYPSFVSTQNGKDRGALCDFAVQPGQTVVVGNFTQPDGTVRGSGDCGWCVRNIESGLPVRRAQVIILPYKPEIAYSATAIRAQVDSGSGRGMVLVTRDNSRQISGCHVELPDLGFTSDLVSVTPQNAAERWSRPGVFTDTLWVPPGVLPQTGPVRIRVTPLGADGHWDFAPQPSLTIEQTVNLTVGVVDDPAPVSTEFSIYPNPVLDVATVQLTLTRPQDVRIQVIDVTGRQVLLVHEGVLASGQQSLSLNASGLAAGVYLVRVTDQDGAVASRTISVVR